MNILNKVTLQTLKRNKVRTIVTIIGIILSAAMITAVTTAVSSGMQYLTEVEAYQSGTWHGAFLNIGKTDAEKLKQDPEVQAVSTIQNIGFAKLDGSKNEMKPYLFIGGIKTGGTGLLPIHITEGKLPTNSGEILIPNHVASNGRVKYKVGQQLTLDIGYRLSDDGEILSNQQSLTYKGGGRGEEDDTAAPDKVLTEKLVPETTRTFTVVGFYERPDFERYDAPGYAALTAYEEAAHSESIYFTLKQPKKIFEFLEHFDYEQTPQATSTYNSGYLRALGVMKDDNFKTMLYGFAAVLIAIVIFGSVALIYNSFSISVNERVKQFGLLSSVGATKKQLLKSVLFEASSLCVIGLPVGLLSGIAGIWVTFSCLQDKIDMVLYGMGDVHLTCHASWMSVLVAAALGFVTVMISAYRPARRALKMSVIDALRQTNDIKIEAKKVHTSKLTYKLFGFEGMIASKNFKRNRRRYRATVISLFVSIVLFISASSFTAYIKSTANVYSQNIQYDLLYTMTPDKDLNAAESETRLQTVYQGLSGISGVSAASYYKQYSTNKILAPIGTLNADYVRYKKERGHLQTIRASEGEYAVLYADLIFLDDGAFREYCGSIGEDAEAYLASAKTAPRGISSGDYIDYDSTSNKRFTSPIFGKSAGGCKIVVPNLPEGTEFIQIAEDLEDTGKPYCYYRFEKEAEHTEIEKVPFDLTRDSTDFVIGKTTSKTPFVVPGTSSSLTLIYPYSAAETMCGMLQAELDTLPVSMAFQAANHAAVFEAMTKYLEENGEASSRVNDYAASLQSERAYTTVLSVFSYGFIILISLIATANVFNTISTNIHLRRREFAMLKSIGTTQRGFRKMMNFECILYGLKGLLYGLPAAFFVTYLIFRVTIRSVERSFFMPWYSVALAVASVFIVVFATMLYAMRQVKKDNPIDALRNENL